MGSLPVVAAPVKSPGRVERAATAVSRLRGWLATAGRRGVVLTGPGPVAWATGGVNLAVDRTAAVDVVWVVVTHDSAVLITTAVEGPRISAELDPGGRGFGLVEVPWWQPDAFVAAAATAAGVPAEELAADGHPGFGIDATDELVALRLRLTTAEQAELRDLGRDAAAALQTALAAWRPGESDFAVAARVGAGLEARGADAPVLIVGGDDRVERFRHPLAIGAGMNRFVMAVVVARRWGLHVAATRFACAGGLSPAFCDQQALVDVIDADVVAASRPGSSYGEVLAVLAQAYRDAGEPGAWQQHYQGGPIGYAQREFELAPGQSDARWFHEPVALGHAVAWNPSLRGGAKREDTYLVTADGAEAVTVAPDWPTQESGEARRPAVLDVDSGEAARRKS